MALRVLEKAREILATPSSLTMVWKPRCARPPKRWASKPGQMFRADPRGRMRAQNCAAAVRNAGGAGPRDCLKRIDQAIAKL